MLEVRGLETYYGDSQVLFGVDFRVDFKPWDLANAAWVQRSAYGGFGRRWERRRRVDATMRRRVDMSRRRHIDAWAR